LLQKLSLTFLRFPSKKMIADFLYKEFCAVFTFVRFVDIVMSFYKL
jgi:hypothetical protein